MSANFVAKASMPRTVYTLMSQGLIKVLENE